MSLARLMRRFGAVIALLVLTCLALDVAAQTEPRPKRKGRSYKVRIDSAPQQAAIYLDDEKYGVVGFTPWEGRLQKGDWKVILKLDGYEVGNRLLTVRRTQSAQEVFLPLVKKDVPATLEVSAGADPNVFGAEVWVDGQMQGTVPSTINVPNGRHLVEIKKLDYQQVSQWIDAKQGQRVTIAPVLKPVKNEPKKGSVLVDADVQGAQVLVDGVAWHDATPTLVTELAEGPHVVEVRKDPAMPWKQTVIVRAGETVKVSAALQASMGGPVGTIRVISNTPGAEIYVDGARVGRVPMDVKDLKPGEHVVEVRAPGFVARRERVAVSAGSATVLEFDLNPEVVSPDKGTIKVVSPIPDAQVSIDGERIGPAPQSKDVPPGEHYVRVEKDGYRVFEQKVAVEKGKALTVTAALRAVGALRVLSTPAGSSVLIDGEEVGKTPLSLNDVEVGEHIISVHRGSYYSYEQNVAIEGGKREVINATLRKIDLGPTDEELLREQRSRSSFGARTLGREKPTVDLSLGYPNFAEIRFNIGVGTFKGFGMDAGLGVGTFFDRTMISLHTRLQLVNRSPVSLGVFGSLGHGTHFDRSKRSTFELNAGGAMSLSALGRVTITTRGYLNLYSDRHCPELQGNGVSFEADTEPSDLCAEYLAMTLPTATRTRVEALLGDEGGANRKLFARDAGARLMLSLAVEWAFDRSWNFWGLLEGTPTLDERPLFTDAFSGFLTETDNGVYVRGGATFKF
jgi:hypothetical protein